MNDTIDQAINLICLEKAINNLKFIDENSNSSESEEENNIGNSPYAIVKNRKLVDYCCQKSNETIEHQAQLFSTYLSPYSLWKRKFMWDWQCSEENIHKEIFFSAIPHLAALIAVPIYLCFGAAVFMNFDDSIASLHFHEILLFAFTTTTTIGYGNIVPEGNFAKLFCIPYCVFGIPLMFITLSKFGELFAELYWICWISLRRREKNIFGENIQRLPLTIIGPIILFHSIFGGMLFNFFLDDMPLYPAIYFCFISITTIGFGDICPRPTSLCQSLFIIFYLSSGISIMSTMFGAISDNLRRIHYLGRDFEHTQDVKIYFDGNQITIRELVSIVAKQFEVPTIRLRQVLDELDVLIKLAALESHRRNCLKCDNNLRQNSQGLSIDESRNKNNSFVLIDQQGQSISSSINTEEEQMIQALSAIHRLSVKGARTFRSPSLNSFTHNAYSATMMLQKIDCKRLTRSMSTSPYNTELKMSGGTFGDAF